MYIIHTYTYLLNEIIKLKNENILKIADDICYLE